MCGNENGFYFLTLNLTIWGKKGYMTHEPTLTLWFSGA